MVIVMYLRQDNVQGWTPLMTAASRDSLALAKALVAKGAAVNARNKGVQLMNTVPRLMSHQLGVVCHHLTNAQDFCTCSVKSIPA